MGWNNFVFAGNATTPEADDAETAYILELGSSSTTMTLPNAIKIVDVVANATMTASHQLRFYVNGKAVGSQFFAAQINPATQGRLNWANQNIVIPQGATVQLKGSQKTTTTAEALTVLVQFTSA